MQGNGAFPLIYESEYDTLEYDNKYHYNCSFCSNLH